jgi:hypothetical protein
VCLLASNCMRNAQIVSTLMGTNSKIRMVFLEACARGTTDSSASMQPPEERFHIMARRSRIAGPGGTVTLECSPVNGHFRVESCWQNKTRSCSVVETTLHELITVLWSTSGILSEQTCRAVKPSSQYVANMQVYEI